MAASIRAASPLLVLTAITWMAHFSYGADPVDVPKSAETTPALESGAVTLNFEKLDKLVAIRQAIEEIDSLRLKGIEIDENGTLLAKLLQEATDVAGFDITSYETLKSKTGSGDPPPTPWERVRGWITFGNIVLVFASIIGVLAIGMLFGHYFLALILAIPIQAWEIICYGACAGLIWGGTRVQPDYVLMTILPGVFGLIGCTVLTDRAHFKGRVDENNYSRRRRRWSNASNEWLVTLQSLFLATAWGFTAVVFQSQVVAFLSIMAMMTACGFIFGVMPWGVYIGFDDESTVKRGTAAGFLVLAFYVLTHVTGVSHPWIDVFKPGANFLGSFVYFLGLLILASKWYDEDNWGFYLLAQILTVVSGVAALWIGSVFGIGTLLGIGGTFFFLYVIEKYFEIPWEGVGWIWAMLFLAIALYFAVGMMKANPEYFLLF